MIPDTATESEGLTGSLRRIGGSLLGLARTRLALFSVELQEEKLRALNLLIWFVVALALAVAGLLVAIAALALILWEAAGYAGLAGLVVGTLSGATAIIWVLRRRILSRPGPFSGTISEFEKDIECFQDRA